MILDGPDLYTLSSTNQHLISDDDLHATAEGYIAFRDAWARKMVEIVYDGPIFANGFETGDTSAWSESF